MENKVKEKNWLDVLRSNIIQGDGKDRSGGAGAARGCAGAKAARQMTAELCKEVMLFKILGYKSMPRDCTSPLRAPRGSVL